MCSNIDCTWPFECQDMDRCFEHDATVPSMRKRAKKRKALASKEEKRHKRVTLGPLGSASRPSLEVLPPSSAQPALGLLSEDLDWLTDLCQQPSAASSTSANTSSGTPLRTTGHSELFMSQGNYQKEIQNCSENSPDARAATAPCALALGDNSYIDWLQSLVPNHGLTLPPPSAECPLVDNNVADLLAAFGSAPNTESSLRAPDTSFMSAFTSGDAVIPRTSRHPSPATSNNSESGHDDLAMLIGGNGDIAKMFSTQPQSSALDPLSLLLSSPPNSAPVAGSTSTVGSIGAIGLLDHYYWSNSQSSAALPISALSSVVPASSIGAKQKLSNTTAAPLDHDIPFDFGQLFSSPPPSATLPPTTDLGAAVQSINADTLIENILGSPTTGCI